MKVDLIVIVIFVLTLILRLSITCSQEEEVLEAPMTKLDVVHVIKLDIILPPIAHGDATLAVGLVTNTKNVQVKKVNQGGVLHTHQQEELVNLGRRAMHEYLKIQRQMLTGRDTLRYGEMKLIKELLEVPTS